VSPPRQSLHILAHRALLDGPDADAENRRTSIDSAVADGFGVEFDITADPASGALVLAHEPCAWNADRDARAFLRDPGQTLHALNVKDLDTLDAVLAEIERAGTQANFFLFDFELVAPDRGPCMELMRRVRQRGFAVAHRLSEREPFLGDLLAATEPPVAVWLDEWARPWVRRHHVAALRDIGTATYYVSPELHRPQPAAALRDRWEELIGFGVTGICTDYPRALGALAGGAP
jgi:glycerophosphoryl diester phosphodiesterase